MSKDVTKDMTTGKPLLLILQFAFPLLIGNFFQQMYNVADAAIVGRFLGPKALAAVGASSSVQFWYLDFASASVVDLEFLSLNALAARISDPCAPISGTAFYHDCCRRPADNDLRPALPCYFTYFNHTSQHL